MNESRVMVTGGASGIGAATVARFRADGCRVAVLDRDPARLADIDAEAHVVADVTDEADIRRGVDEGTAALGGLDVLVSCAGIGGRGTVADLELADWEHIFAVNVRGVYLAAKAAIPHLRHGGGGAIVNVASQLGLVAAANSAAYCASKGAVVQLTKAMAIDHGSEGIRVNCVCPGPTLTPLFEEWFVSSDDPVRERKAYEQMHVHGRVIQADEVADAIAYLASPRALSTIGAVLVVDAGYTIH